MTLTYSGALVRLACLLPLLFAVAFGPNLYCAWWMREKRRRGWRILANGVWL